MNKNIKEIRQKNMDYETFITEMADRIQQHADKGTRIHLEDMTANNGISRKGITIQEKGRNTAPILYLEPYYACYLEGTKIEELAEAAYKAFLDYRLPQNLDTSVFRDYKKVKERVLFKLVNYKRNEQQLQEVPHRKYLDLAAVCYCPLDKEELPGAASVLIRKEHLALWQTTEEELLESAFRNTPRLLGHQLLDMEDVIRGFLPEGTGVEFPKSKDRPPEMLILTNQSKVNGAACLLYPGLLEKLAEERNSSFIILPSSIHELLLVPVTDSIERAETAAYTQMVKEVNQTALAEEEILSDHAYFYDRSRSRVSAA